jgi:hypothetical protein
MASTECHTGVAKKNDCTAMSATLEAGAEFRGVKPDFGRVLLLSPPQGDEAALALLQPAHFAFDIDSGSVARHILR